MGSETFAEFDLLVEISFNELEEEKGIVVALPEAVAFEPMLTGGVLDDVLVGDFPEEGDLSHEWTIQAFGGFFLDFFDGYDLIGEFVLCLIDEAVGAASEHLLPFVVVVVLLFSEIFLHYCALIKYKRLGLFYTGKWRQHPDEIYFPPLALLFFDTSQMQSHLLFFI